ncbi:MAG: T9SS type A sorting domain-containing protein [Flavipsychrobacter sp.]
MLRKTSYIVILISLLAISNYTYAQYAFERFNLNPHGAMDSNPFRYVATDSFLFFAAKNDYTGFEPWKSDGTLAGTKVIKEICTGGCSGTWGITIGSLNDKLIFVGSDYTHGEEPWVTDGTANGTYMLKDINSGFAPSSNVMPKSFTIGNKLYFTAGSSTHGLELWETDGTTNGTKLLKDINPGGHSEPNDFIHYNGKVYFVAYDGTHGFELWVTDGTTNGTKMVKDIYTGSLSAHPSHLIVYNNKLYFVANDATHGKELWVTDGTTNGTTLVKDFTTGYISTFFKNFILYNNKLFFDVLNGNTGNSEIWETDGTTSGTKATSSGFLGNEQIIFNGKIYCDAMGELFSFDGTSSGLQLIKDIDPISGQAANPKSFNIIGNKLVFKANDGVHNEELWVTDGTTNGTILLKDINTDPKSSADPSTITKYGNMLIFRAIDSSKNIGIYATDGTTNGTIKLKGYDSVTRFSVKYSFTLYDSSLYFTAYDTGGYEMWKLTDTTLNTPPPNAVAALKNTPSKIQVAPNPAHDRVYITLDKAYSNAQLTITDITGRSILKQSITNTQTQIEVALPNLPTGTYLLNVHHKDGVLSQRLLIE